MNEKFCFVKVLLTYSRDPYRMSLNQQSHFLYVFYFMFFY